MRGIVNHESAGKKWESKYSMSKGNQLDEVLLVDGLFIVLHKNRIKKSFNESVKGFHFYDVDFSFRNFLDGVKIGVLYDIRITHKSIGQTNDEWEKNRKKFSIDFEKFLPSKVLTNVKNNPYFKVLVFSKNFPLAKKLIDQLIYNKLNVSFYGIFEKNSEVKKLENKNVKFFTIDKPYGYMLGDGQWGFNTQNGFVVSEKNKKYKVKEFDYDIIHNMEPDMLDFLKDIYPNAYILNEENSSQSIEDILEKYYNIIND